MTESRVRAPFEDHPIIRWLLIATLGLVFVLFVFLAANPPEGASKDLRLIASFAAALMCLGIIALIWPWRFFVVFRMLGFAIFAGYLTYFFNAWLVQGISIRFTGNEEERASGRALLGLLKFGGLGLGVAIFARTPTRPKTKSTSS